jgi:hypothetical protein
VGARGSIGGGIDGSRRCTAGSCLMTKGSSRRSGSALVHRREATNAAAAGRARGSAKPSGIQAHELHLPSRVCLPAVIRGAACLCFPPPPPCAGIPGVKAFAALCLACLLAWISGGRCCVLRVAAPRDLGETASESHCRPHAGGARLPPPPVGRRGCGWGRAGKKKN